VVGKTRTAEFAGPHPTTTRNPHDPRRTPGGSSSGSAAAVAAGFVTAAVGTPTIGSVIRPASYCGVVGFKTTHGRLALDGAIACAPSCDSFGLFATSVPGVALLASVLPGAGRPSPARPVPAIPSQEFLNLAAAATLADYRAAIRILSEAGFTVLRTRLAADLQPWPQPSRSSSMSSSAEHTRTGCADTRTGSVPQPAR
jgi:Asp-tRNA(Asn)/Glu-tRNA(Gln) amidotransferase A subunit family amidase